jgi:hypothetical protein
MIPLLRRGVYKAPTDFDPNKIIAYTHTLLYNSNTHTILLLLAKKSIILQLIPSGAHISNHGK